MEQFGGAAKASSPLLRPSPSLALCLQCDKDWTAGLTRIVFGFGDVGFASESDVVCRPHVGLCPEGFRAEQVQ